MNEIRGASRLALAKARGCTYGGSCNAEPFGFAPHSLQPGASPPIKPGTSQGKLLEVPRFPNRRLFLAVNEILRRYVPQNDKNRKISDLRNVISREPFHGDREIPSMFRM
jgi:hypothetical protein